MRERDKSQGPESDRKLQKGTTVERSRDKRKQKGRSGPGQWVLWGMMGWSGSHSVKRPREEQAEKARYLGITVDGVLMLHPS